MWMNSVEIDIAAQRIREPLDLQEAARFLQAFRDLIDEISDGWAHWHYGTRCSQDLQALVGQAQWPANRLHDTPELVADARKSCRKVLVFLARCRQTRDNPRVQEFLKTWKSL